MCDGVINLRGASKSKGSIGIPKIENLGIEHILISARAWVGVMMNYPQRYTYDKSINQYDGTTICAPVKTYRLCLFHNYTPNCRFCLKRLNVYRGYDDYYYIGTIYQIPNKAGGGLCCLECVILVKKLLMFKIRGGYNHTDVHQDCEDDNCELQCFRLHKDSL
jgi:hypothetical protein